MGASPVSSQILKPQNPRALRIANTYQSDVYGESTNAVLSYVHLLPSHPTVDKASTFLGKCHLQLLGGTEAYGGIQLFLTQVYLGLGSNPRALSHLYPEELADWLCGLLGGKHGRQAWM